MKVNSISLYKRLLVVLGLGAVGGLWVHGAMAGGGGLAAGVPPDAACAAVTQTVELIADRAFEQGFRVAEAGAVGQAARWNDTSSPVWAISCHISSPDCGRLGSRATFPHRRIWRTIASAVWCSAGKSPASTMSLLPSETFVQLRRRSALRAKGAATA